MFFFKSAILLCILFCTQFVFAQDPVLNSTYTITFFNNYTETIAFSSISHARDADGTDDSNEYYFKVSDNFKFKCLNEGEFLNLPKLIDSNGTTILTQSFILKPGESKSYKFSSNCNSSVNIEPIAYWKTSRPDYVEGDVTLFIDAEKFMPNFSLQPFENSNITALYIYNFTKHAIDPTALALVFQPKQ